MKLLRPLLILVLAAPFLAGAGVDFDREIRPLLSDSCFQCHGPDDAERKADLRLDTRAGLFGEGMVVAGNPEASELLARIAHHDPEERMPPAKSGLKLSASQIARIRTWISEGAHWEQHWSLIPPVRPAEPKVSPEHAEWVRNPIDAFVLARLEQEGLQPSPPADPRLLARRLYFDLTGLPPIPEEVEQFLRTSLEETAALLFRSPAYGEKMAVRWLDAARYADTSGYQSDGWREMWRWRDWVIEAYHRNQPFDQFTIEQLAGDLLPDPTLDQLIATGFNRNHRGNAEGGIVPEEFQVEYVVDRVDTTFAVWQGLTMGCARCHSHKYDPISQRDYYQVFAAFNNLPEYGRAWKEGNSEPFLKAPTPDQAEELRRLEAQESAARKTFQQLSGNVSAADLKALPTELPEDWTLEDGLIVRQSSRESREDVAEFGHFDAFSFGAWIHTRPGDSGTLVSRMVPVDQGAGYNLHLTEGGTIQANFVKRWLDDSVRLETASPIPPGWAHVFVTYDGTRRARGIRIYINGEPVQTRANHDFLNISFKVEEPLRIGQGMSTFTGQLEEVHVYERCLEPGEVGVLAVRDGLTEIQSGLADSTLTELQKAKLLHYYVTDGGPKAVREAYQRWTKAKRSLARFEASIPSVMVMRDSMPRQTRVLHRGQYDQPGEAIEPGVPASLPPLPEGTPPNRLGIARWLVSGENPLTARVLVNRLWRDVFGTGLVKTTEDFGVQGERPSHPDLLDWLAVELVESGWDLQHLLRLIVTSQTYRQSSPTTPALQQRDPENRLLARGPRFRLPAEMIRDQALAVSGTLHRKVGGPSVKPYQPEGLWKDIASDTNYVQATGPDLYRRSLYTYWKRTVPPPLMINFDASGREACDVALRRTNTPLQALNLLNDVTFVEAARVLAQRTMTRPESDAEILESMFLTVLSRKPSARERRLLLDGKKAHLETFAADPEAARKLTSSGEWPGDADLPVEEWAAWTLIGSTLLNLDETVTKE